MFPMPVMGRKARATSGERLGSGRFVVYAGSDSEYLNPVEDIKAIGNGSIM